MTRVFITGLGVCASNGIGKEAFAQGLASAVSGITACHVFSTAGLSTDQFGECAITADRRLETLIRLSASEMLQDANITPDQLAAEGVHARRLFGTLLAQQEQYQEAVFQQSSEPLAAMQDYITMLKQLTGIQGAVTISAAACAASTTVLGMAYEYIHSGLCDIAVVGGADALAQSAAYGFQALKALSCHVCNPFDKERDGISIGEGAAFFLLESEEHAKARGARRWGEIAGYALANDAYHATSPDPEGAGAVYTMREALRMAKKQPQEVDYINAHGTGTRLNDAMEVTAIQKIWQGQAQKPRVSSTKALLGHCMGASGALELASVLLAMKQEVGIAMPRLQSPMVEDIPFVKEAEQLSTYCVLSNSFAFAGNCASLLVQCDRKEPT